LQMHHLAKDVLTD